MDDTVLYTFFYFSQISLHYGLVITLSFISISILYHETVERSERGVCNGPHQARLCIYLYVRYISGCALPESGRALYLYHYV
jgi:hypothetical protein